MTVSSFEIRRTAAGFQVYSTTSGDWGNGSGLASSVTFPSEAAAKAWVAEQFGIPVNAWTNRNGSLVAQR